MNPYAQLLGGRDPIAVISSTPEKLAALVRSVQPDEPQRSPSSKWSIREILCHLADSEVAFAFRIRQTLAEPHHVVQPLDQDRWAENYGCQDVQTALRVFAALRDWNVRLVRTLPPDTFSKRLTHPERGELTFQVLIETMAGHDLNHLSRIEEMAGSRSGLPDS